MTVAPVARATGIASPMWSSWACLPRIRSRSEKLSLNASGHDGIRDVTESTLPTRPTRPTQHNRPIQPTRPIHPTYAPDLLFCPHVLERDRLLIDPPARRGDVVRERARLVDGFGHDAEQVLAVGLRRQPV